MKIKIFLTTFLFILFILPAVVFAANVGGSAADTLDGYNTLWQFNTKKQSDKNVLSHDVNNEQFFQSTGNSLLNFWNRNIYGIDPEVLMNAGLNPSEGMGAAGQISKIADSLISKPPVNTATYLADIGRQAGFVKSAYAQSGVGYKALEPTLQVWKAFRNIAYVGFAIIFIVVGLMIMLGQKVGQSALTIQMALPQIIISLLLVTFSYAIASLAIDLIYLLIYLIVGIFKINILTGNVDTINELLNNNIIQYGWNHIIMGGQLSTGADAVGNLVQSIVQDFAGATIGAVTGFITQNFALLIIGIMIIYSLFAMFLQLLTSYIAIILSVVFAPITLLFNAVPGSNNFTQWIKMLLANALVFPVTAILLLVAGALLGDTSLGVKEGFGYAALKGNSTSVALPFLSLNSSAIVGIIGFGMLMILPQALKQFKKSMGVEDGLAAAFMPVFTTPFSATGKLASGIGGIVGVNKARKYASTNAPVFGSATLGNIRANMAKAYLRSKGINYDLEQAVRGKS